MLGVLIFAVAVILLVVAGLAIQRIIGKKRMEGKGGAVIIQALTLGMLFGMGTPCLYPIKT